MERWQCLFCEYLLAMPALFHRAFPIFHRTFPFRNGLFPFFFGTLPATIGRWSRDHRAVVAGHLPDKNGYRAGAFRYNRDTSIYIVLCEIHSQTLVQLADVCNFVADKMLVCIISISKIWFARGAS